MGRCNTPLCPLLQNRKFILKQISHIPFHFNLQNYNKNAERNKY